MLEAAGKGRGAAGKRKGADEQQAAAAPAMRQRQSGGGEEEGEQHDSTSDAAGMEDAGGQQLAPGRGEADAWQGEGQGRGTTATEAAATAEAVAATSPLVESQPARGRHRVGRQGLRRSKQQEQRRPRQMELVVGRHASVPLRQQPDARRMPVPDAAVAAAAQDEVEAAIAAAMHVQLQQQGAAAAGQAVPGPASAAAAGQHEQQGQQAVGQQAAVGGFHPPPALRAAIADVDATLDQLAVVSRAPSAAAPQQQQQQQQVMAAAPGAGGAAAAPLNLLQLLGLAPREAGQDAAVPLLQAYLRAQLADGAVDGATQDAAMRLGLLKPAEAGAAHPCGIGREDPFGWFAALEREEADVVVERLHSKVTR